MAGVKREDRQGQEILYFQLVLAEVGSWLQEKEARLNSKSYTPLKAPTGD